MVQDRSFLGTGWSFPPTFTEGGAGVEMVSEAEDAVPQRDGTSAPDIGPTTRRPRPGAW